jgi:hypothetical protein
MLCSRLHARETFAQASVAFETQASLPDASPASSLSTAIINDASIGNLPLHG